MRKTGYSLLLPLYWAYSILITQSASNLHQKQYDSLLSAGGDDRVRVINVSFVLCFDKQSALHTLVYHNKYNYPEKIPPYCNYKVYCLSLKDEPCWQQRLWRAMLMEIYAQVQGVGVHVWEVRTVLATSYFWQHCIPSQNSFCDQRFHKVHVTYTNSFLKHKFRLSAMPRGISCLLWIS